MSEVFRIIGKRKYKTLDERMLSSQEGTECRIITRNDLVKLKQRHGNRLSTEKLKYRTIIIQREFS